MLSENERRSCLAKGNRIREPSIFRREASAFVFNGMQSRIADSESMCRWHKSFASWQTALTKMITMLNNKWNNHQHFKCCGAVEWWYVHKNKQSKEESPQTAQMSGNQKQTADCGLFGALTTYLMIEWWSVFVIELVCTGSSCVHKTSKFTWIRCDRFTFGLDSNSKLIDRCGQCANSIRRCNRSFGCAKSIRKTSTLPMP